MVLSWLFLINWKECYGLVMNKIKRPSNLEPGSQLERVWDCIEEWQRDNDDKTGNFIASKLKIKSTSLSRILHGKRGLTPGFLQSLAEILGVNPLYLMKKSNEKYTNPTPEEKKSSDLEEVELALRVLRSDTHYSDSLRKNIRSFHGAIEETKRLVSEIELLREENIELRSMIQALEAKVKNLEVNFFSSGGLQTGEYVTPPIPSTSLKK